MRIRARPGHPSLFDWLDRVEARVVAQNAALEHERQAGRGPRRPTHWTLNRGRLADIQKLIRLRHCGPCDTDDGLIYLKAALPHLVRLHAGSALLGKILTWAATWLPGLPQDQVACAVDIDSATANTLLKADDLGQLLRVTRQEREDLGLKTIGALNFTLRQRRAERKRKDEAYQAKKRLKAGATPRAESNVAKAKALGMSLSTYKRRLKEALLIKASNACEPISSAVVRSTYSPLRDRVTGQERTVQGPAREGRAKLSASADGPSPSAKARAVVAGRARALPLPADGVSEHPDMLGGGEWKQLGASLSDYEGGVLPDELVRAIRDAQRVRQMTQETLAHQIGISRPQLANALQRRFGLSRSAATNLKEWLVA